MSRKRLGTGGQHRRRSWLRRRGLLVAGALGVGVMALRRSRPAGEGDDVGSGGGDSADHAERASRGADLFGRASGKAKEVGRLMAAVPARLTPVAGRALEVAGRTATTVRDRLRQQRPAGDPPATGEPAEPVAAEASAEQERAAAPEEDGEATKAASAAEALTGEAGTGGATPQQE